MADSGGADQDGADKKMAKGRPASGKDERLAEALRANLRRRKAQSAARKDLSESAVEPNDGAAPETDEQTEQKRN